MSTSNDVGALTQVWAWVMVWALTSSPPVSKRSSIFITAGGVWVSPPPLIVPTTQPAFIKEQKYHWRPLPPSKKFEAKTKSNEPPMKCVIMISWELMKSQRISYLRKLFFDCIVVSMIFLRQLSEWWTNGFVHFCVISLPHKLLVSWTLGMKIVFLPL